MPDAKRPIGSQQSFFIRGGDSVSRLHLTLILLVAPLTFNLQPTSQRHFC